MGGRDKGLQRHRGAPLVRLAIDRLRPQVDTMAISANRHLPDYAAFGLPVWPDTVPDHPGPLAGWLSALTRASTDWVVTVPCDAPDFPPDLVRRLAASLEGGRLAIAQTDERVHPVFALLHRSLADELSQALSRGERRVLGWADALGARRARFPAETAFGNLNTLDDLAPDTNG